MRVEQEIQLEKMAHDLLAGELDEWDRTDALWRIATEDDAREKLAETIQLQRDVRAALGGDIDREFVQTSLAATLEAIRRQVASETGSRSTWSNIVRPGLLVAAVLLVGAVGIIAGRILATASDTIQPHEQVIAQEPSPPPQLADADREVLKRTWQQVAQAGSNSWLVMADGKGEFGYLTKPATNGSAGPVLIRCVIHGEGLPASQVFVLVPSQQPAELSVPAAVTLDGRPVELAVTSMPGRGVQVAVRLRSAAATDAAGLHATVAAGQPATEVGRFRCDNRVVKVYLEAQPLEPVPDIS